MPYDLRSYMGGRYVQINQHLRNGRPGTGIHQVMTPPLKNLEDSLPVIDRELDDLGKPVLAGQLVYRRAGPTDQYANPYVRQPGFVFIDLAYLSTSANARYSWASRSKDDQKQLFFTITCMAMGGGRDVATVRQNLPEAEVLFHRNTQFRLLRAERDSETDTANVHWVFEEIDSPHAGYVWGAHRA
jgi:hypothetical protein